MSDDMMRMGGGMPAQGQTQAPTGQMPQPQAAGMCPMCAMMQNMMRMGAAQPGMTPPMSGGPAAGAGMAPGSAASPVADSVPRLEGRIAYLRSALRITEPQAAGWDAFAAALRTGRGHLDAARNALEGANAAADPMARLESYEGHLVARLEAIRTTRLAFNALYDQLDEAQKRAATTTMLPFIGAF
ncbi:Spy/CpxP family protein refolding chaperone [Roseicella aerolata]|uniref:Spy/CpxP family protein refolding chaperone n=1 Tax=Roseicella aerolata TaxID=2883479 RepID=A0A9X1LAK6_9PROT|nr:Spy/CpxP family protein refolding chaperone [Roseicella aerolata]MCB4824934.1 Spy/CpxP family protein refolding chaperone [Roseicella aerolata]